MKTIRNIKLYENRKKRKQAGTGHEFMLDRNTGLLEYAQKKSFDLPEATSIRGSAYDASSTVPGWRGRRTQAMDSKGEAPKKCLLWMCARGKMDVF